MPVEPHCAAKSPDYDLTLGALEEHLEKIERKAISHALDENNGDKTAAAKQLGLSFRSLRYRLKKLGIED